MIFVTRSQFNFLCKDTRNPDMYLIYSISQEWYVHDCALSHFVVSRSMVESKIVLFPTHWQWGYYSLAQSHRDTTEFCPVSFNIASLAPGQSCDYPLQWRHNDRDVVSNHQPHDCLQHRLFKYKSKKTSKHRVTGLYTGNSPVNGEFPARRASNAENVSIWWRHHAKCQWSNPEELGSHETRVPSQHRKTIFSGIDSHYKDKTVVRPSYLYTDGNPYMGKTTSLYWYEPQQELNTELQQNIDMFYGKYCA